MRKKALREQEGRANAAETGEERGVQLVRRREVLRSREHSLETNSNSACMLTKVFPFHTEN